MNELVYKETSRVLIEELRVELKSQAESFVKAGYLLKVARDTDILKDTSYANVNDLATAEYGLTPDMVSRYIRIYERFGDGEGNLLTEYQGYGVAKLQIMITLPDEINEQLSPEMTKSQITEVASEVHEEQKISDMEVMCEDPGNKEWSALQHFFMAYFEDHRQQFLMIFDYEKPFPGEDDYLGFKEIFFPAGTEMIFARIPQSGKVMLSAEGVLTYIRSGERIEYTWEEIYKEIAHELQAISHFTFTPDGYADLFGKNPEPVAPVQEAQSPKKEKTAEQKYNEEQARIDKDVKKKLEERHDEEVQAAGPTYQTHELKLTDVFWEDVASGKKKFELRKNDRGYKVGDTLLMMRYADGKDMGDRLTLKITYMLEEYTGLAEGYAILGTELMTEIKEEPLPGQMTMEVNNE